MKLSITVSAVPEISISTNYSLKGFALHPALRGGCTAAILGFEVRLNSSFNARNEGFAVDP